MTTALAATAALLGLYIGVFPLQVAWADTLAHPGGATVTTSTHFHPDDDSLFLLDTTFGLLVSKDSGESFRWVCEEAIGSGSALDSDYVVTHAGEIYATTLTGLRRSRDGACSFEATEFYGDPTGADQPVLLEDYFVSAIDIAKDGTIWATTATAAQSNDVYTSSDGLRFESANAWSKRILWRSVLVAPRDPQVVYLSGSQPRVDLDPRTNAPVHLDPVQDPPPETAMARRSKSLVLPARAVLRKTIDGGATWLDLDVSGFEFGSQPNLIVLGISPNDSDLVYAKVTNVGTELGDALYRSENGGQQFTKVGFFRGQISAFLIRADDRVLVGSVTPCLDEPLTDDAGITSKGCVLTSPDGSPGSFTTPASEPRLACLSERPRDQALFACASNWEPDYFALGRSEDNGESWTKVLRFPDIAGPLECPPQTIQYSCEQQLWPILCGSLDICGGEDAGPTIVAPPHRGCLDCAAGGTGTWPPLLLLLGYWLALRRRPGK